MGSGFGAGAGGLGITGGAGVMDVGYVPLLGPFLSNESPGDHALMKTDRTFIRYSQTIFV
jgi:hypothetical protein